MFKISDAEWCNGSTADSDSVSRGSNPFSVGLKKDSRDESFWNLFFVIGN